MGENSLIESGPSTLAKTFILLIIKSLVILIVNNHSPYVKELREIVEKRGMKIVVVDQRDDLSSIRKQEIEGIILSGGGPNLDRLIDIDDIKADIVSILNFSAPILGICEGHQIIAQVFGGKINRLKKYFEKENKITILKKSAIFEGLDKEIIMKESHGRYVKSISEDFVIAATSEKTKIEAVFHKSKPIFSVQFHPEASGPNGQKIIENFLDICTKKEAPKAAAATISK